MSAHLGWCQGPGRGAELQSQQMLLISSRSWRPKTLSSLNRHGKPQMVSGKVLSVMWACLDMCVTLTTAVRSSSGGDAAAFS